MTETQTSSEWSIEPATVAPNRIPDILWHIPLGNILGNTLSQQAFTLRSEWAPMQLLKSGPSNAKFTFLSDHRTPICL